jgi:adenosine deaminase
VPLLQLLDAGIPVALGADDPLLFGSRLNAQYDLVRHVHGLSDEQLAELARMSVRASAAPAGVRSALLAGIDAWIASPVPSAASGAEPAPAPAAREPAQK